MEELRRDVLIQTKQYAELLLESKPFVPGETPVPVSGKVLRPADLVALVDSSLDGWLTTGPHTVGFERELARYVGTRHALIVHSGSSANLVALSPLTSPRLGRRRLESGDEVLTVAMG